MKILYRYLNLEFVLPIFGIMIGLIGILSFFDFIQEMNDLGKERIAYLVFLVMLFLVSQGMFMK